MKNIAVFCGSSMPRDGRIARLAEELGSAIAQRGYTLVYGGSNLGLMGLVSGAALRGGAWVVGIIPRLFPDEVVYSQPGVQVQVVGSMAERKERIIAMCDAFVALPGGIGTIDEVSEVLVANQLHQIDKPMVLLNHEGYYDPFLQQLKCMEQEGLIRPDTTMRLRVATTVDEALQI